MAVVPTWLSTLRLITLAGAWSAAMVVVGLLAMLDWPGRLATWGKPGMVFGAVLVASGAYTFAFFAGRAFPLANRAVVAVFEIVPWIVMGIVVVGGLGGDAGGLRT